MACSFGASLGAREGGRERELRTRRVSAMAGSRMRRRGCCHEVGMATTITSDSGRGFGTTPASCVSWTREIQKKEHKNTQHKKKKKGVARERPGEKERRRVHEVSGCEWQGRK